MQLQLRIEQYEKTLLAKNGEVAILRDQKDQQRREWDRKMAQLTNAHGEEKEKIRAECELLRVARDQTQTELLFVMKERDDAVRRERAIARKVHQSTQEVLAPAPTSQEPAAALAAARNEGPSTPRHKDRSYAFRDGFEDDDVLMASPSKRGGAKTRTPTKTGLKRKRSVNGSPLPQLHLSQSRSASVATERVPTIDDKVLEKLFAQDDRLEVRLWLLRWFFSFFFFFFASLSFLSFPLPFPFLSLCPLLHANQPDTYMQLVLVLRGHYTTQMSNHTGTNI